jgi:hypothetical protein
MGKQEKYKAKEDNRDVFDKALEDDSEAGWGPVGGAALGMFAGPVVSLIARRRAITKKVDAAIKKSGKTVSDAERQKMYLDADNRQFAREGGISRGGSSPLIGAATGAAIGTPIEYYSKRSKRRK